MDQNKNTEPVIQTALLFLEDKSNPGGETPWPLIRIAGLPLVERHLLSLKKAGITQVYVMCGTTEFAAIKPRLAGWTNDACFPIISLHSPDDPPIPCIPERVLVLDGRRVFHPKLLGESLVREGTFAYILNNQESPGIGALSGIAPIMSLDLLRSLPRILLSEDALIQKMQTPEDRRSAEWMIFNSLIKDTDGWFSRRLNRPVSLRISRYLIRYPIHPHVITFFTFLVGLASGWLAAQGSYLFIVMGSVLYQISSILDGVDGEVARGKFKTSRMGQWLDMVCDDLTNVFYLAGVTVGVYRICSSKLLLWLSVTGIAIYIITFLLMYWQLYRSAQPPTLLTFQKEIHRPEFRKKILAPLILALQPLVKRDFYGYAFLVMSLTGLAWLINLWWLVGIIATLTFVLGQIMRSRSGQLPAPGIDPYYEK